MKKSQVSVNIHKQVVSNTANLDNFLHRIKPAAVLVLDDLDYADDLADALPGTNVIFREHGSGGDETIHLQKTPEEWVAYKLRQREKAPGVWMHTTNEPEFHEDTLKWHIRSMEMAIPERLPMIVGNWGAGIIPKPEDLPKFPSLKRFLELLTEHSDLFILGAHEYGCGVMTSGLVGGAPDDPGHANYIIPENWPKTIAGLTAFHCGRFQFMTNYARDLGLKKKLRLILTEHGMDDLSDIKFWSDKLKVTSGYHNIRGWKSITEQWKAWYGERGWSAERAYFEQLKWANEAIYINSEVEAQCVFSWGHSSQMWEQFDIAEAWELQDLLADYGETATAPEVPPVVVVPPIVVVPPEPQTEPPVVVEPTEPPPVSPPESVPAPERYLRVFTFQIDERTEAEADAVTGWLKAAVEERYRFLQLLRLTSRTEADVTIAKAYEIVARELEYGLRIVGN